MIPSAYHFVADLSTDMVPSTVRTDSMCLAPGGVVVFSGSSRLVSLVGWGVRGRLVLELIGRLIETRL